MWFKSPKDCYFKKIHWDKPKACIKMSQKEQNVQKNVCSIYK